MCFAAEPPSHQVTNRLSQPPHPCAQPRWLDNRHCRLCDTPGHSETAAPLKVPVLTGQLRAAPRPRITPKHAGVSAWSRPLSRRMPNSLETVDRSGRTASWAVTLIINCILLLFVPSGLSSNKHRRSNTHSSYIYCLNIQDVTAWTSPVVFSRGCKDRVRSLTSPHTKHDF
jgi:hypothetical protein